MSTLSKCCACGCQPEQLFWVQPGPNATAAPPEGALPTGPTGCVEEQSFTYGGPKAFHRLTGECNSLVVTTETNRDTLVFDVQVNPPAIAFGTFIPNAKAFDIQLKLWCDGEGQHEVGTVRLWAELGSRLQDTQFTQDPDSFATAIPSFGPLVVYNTCWFKVYASLTTDGQPEAVQIICPTTLALYGTSSQNYYEGSVFFGIAFRVTATYADGECDVNCAYTLYDDYGEQYRDYYEGYSEDPGPEVQGTFSPQDTGAMGIALYGTSLNGQIPARRHLFPTASAIKQHKRAAATIEVNDDWKWDIRIRAKSYSPAHAPAVPAVPEETEEQCVCTPTGATGPADCFVSRTPGATVTPQDPYLYPWYLSPCSHVRRGSRITHGRVSNQFENLLITLPEYQGAPYEWNGYVSQIPHGPYELNGERNGTPLADDTFWLAAGSVPVVTTPGVYYYGYTWAFRTDSVTIAASIRTTLIQPGGGYSPQNLLPVFPLTVLSPCPGSEDEWQTSVMVFVYVRGRFVNQYYGGEFPGDAYSQPFAIWITHAHSVSSSFFRGEEISISGSGAGCRAQWYGVNPNPAETTTLFQLSYATPMKVKLLGE